MTPSTSTSTSHAVGALDSGVIKTALELTNMLKVANKTFSHKDGRKYIVLDTRTHRLDFTTNFNLSTSICQLTAQFDTFLSCLPEETEISNNLYEEIGKYTHHMVEAESETPRVKVRHITTVAKKAGIQPSKSTEATGPAAPPAAHAKKARFATLAAAPERYKISVPSFSDLISNPRISTEALSNAFKKEIRLELLTFYHDPKNADERISKLNAERMGYYLTNAFNQSLSNVTDLIGKIKTPQMALEQLQVEFDKVYKIYQEIPQAEIDMGLPPSLGDTVIAFIRELVQKPATTEAFKTYFEQIIKENEKVIGE